MIKVILKSGHGRRVQRGHPWVFSNEVERVEAAEGAAGAPGAPAVLADPLGRPIGFGYYNRNSLIAFRWLAAEPVDEGALIMERLRAAVAFRERVAGDTEAQRLVYSEGDLLPGLVVDRYADTLVAQIQTAGMERLTPQVLAALEAVVAPRVIVLRNDAPVRQLEGLPLDVRVVRGALDGPVRVRMDGLTFHVDPVGGQKTGLFLDHRENRQALRRYVKGARVLDLFCYGGAWGLYALAGGAASVVGVDDSAPALAAALANAEASGFAGRFQTHDGDVFDVLKKGALGEDLFDVVIVDPPAFARSRKDIPAACKAYERVNKLALKSLAPGGILATSSCSHHVGPDEFMEAVSRAVASTGRRARLLEQRGQAVDHAGLLSMTEGDYLKCAFLQVL